MKKSVKNHSENQKIIKKSGKSRSGKEDVAAKNTFAGCCHQPFPAQLQLLFTPLVQYRGCPRLLRTEQRRSLRTGGLEHPAT
ncbi:unnamed protein product [Cuscuta europaea]|uniref:Uncharacterized protein n=1 Tax=Cuscuta europaea TaxID=41803 RepID=A0A9P1EN88_CUSEU|nr:unnamed protein product [Cuscuta europaea]